MENDKLITLSAFVDKIIKDYLYCSEALLAIHNYNKFLKTDLHLSHFIPTDENGKPLEKPTINTPVESAQFRMAMSDYQQAHEKVIFEGWAVTKRNEVVMTIKADKYALTYNANRKDFALKTGLQFLGFIKTLADLAESTKSNPLTLKTKS